MFGKFRKGINRAMDEPVKVYKEILVNGQNRLILGLMLVGLGSGLVASGYLRASC